MNTQGTTKRTIEILKGLSRLMSEHIQYIPILLIKGVDELEISRALQRVHVCYVACTSKLSLESSAKLFQYANLVNSQLQTLREVCALEREAYLFEPKSQAQSGEDGFRYFSDQERPRYAKKDIRKMAVKLNEDLSKLEQILGIPQIKDIK